jgi:hypothetical protein
MLCPVEGCAQRLVGHVCHRPNKTETPQGWTISFRVHPSTVGYIRSPATDWDPVQSSLQETTKLQSKHMLLSASWPTGNILEGGTSSTINEDDDDKNLQMMTRTMSIQVPLMESPNQLTKGVRKDVERVCKKRHICQKTKTRT